MSHTRNIPTLDFDPLVDAILKPAEQGIKSREEMCCILGHVFYWISLKEERSTISETSTRNTAIDELTSIAYRCRGVNGPIAPRQAKQTAQRAFGQKPPAKLAESLQGFVPQFLASFDNNHLSAISGLLFRLAQKEQGFVYYKDGQRVTIDPNDANYLHLVLAHAKEIISSPSLGGVA